MGSQNLNCVAIHARLRKSRMDMLLSVWCGKSAILALQALSLVGWFLLLTRRLLASLKMKVSNWSDSKQYMIVTSICNERLLQLIINRGKTAEAYHANAKSNSWQYRNSIH